ncbi:MAG: L-seryl-tRNA(Sec) selenium transferase [Deltaproteobacteria bacterium]|nr:L-seryl-tRNA(Sec) selenium transferase [Candidatus Zymogenaceae bacterium]
MPKKTENPAPRSVLSRLPAVEKLLSHPHVRELAGRFPPMVVKQAVRDAVSDARGQLKSGPSSGVISEPTLLALIEDWLLKSITPRLTPVINATGIILHTNLGRAPLADGAMDHVVAIASGYSNLEFNLDEGRRGSRRDHLSGVITEITGAPASLIVNNNAAAVLVALNSLAEGREVIVSRGELVEIGGAFRIPDVMEKSGACLREVGTTNRTRLSDYEGAIGSQTALLLKVHTSNYRIVGFTEEVSASELVALGKRYDVPVMEDLGSGSIIDLAPWGLPHEPTVPEVVSSGVDVITFSGDKLLGASQAGFVVGAADYIDRIAVNPLSRAVRVDKMTLAAIESTLMLYRDHEEALSKIPVIRMITMSYDETKGRATRIARRLNREPHPNYHVGTADDCSGVGGGAFPTAELPSRVVTIIPLAESPDKLEERLRRQDVPIVARITHERLILDPRTVTDRQIPNLIRGTVAALRGDTGSQHTNRPEHDNG